MARKTQIHNNTSGVTIYLIPFTKRFDQGREEFFPVKNRLVEKIPAGGSPEVSCDKYKPDDPFSNSQTYILFRAANTADKDITKPEILRRIYPRGIELAIEEKAFMHDQLSAERNWYIRRNEGGQGIAIYNGAVQTSVKIMHISEPNSAGTLRGSELQYLREELEILRRDVEALRRRIEGITNLANGLPR